MRWQIKIEGQPKKRILVTFYPQGEIILFQGQYNTKNHWIDFSSESHPMEIDLETIQSLLIKVYDTMNKRLMVYEDLNKSFGIIKNVEMQSGELLINGELLIDNSIYGSPVENIEKDNV